MMETTMTAADCDKEIFEHGKTVGWIDACSYIAEEWVKSIAAESGQRVDWHRAGGRAVIRFIGDRDKVLAAIGKLEPELRKVVKKEPEHGCGSCTGHRGEALQHHRPARILHIQGTKKE
jgi:hypothetical protein